MRFAFLSLTLVLVTACSKPEPVELGFLGNLSGRTANLDIEALSGMILAIEQWNDRGGIFGQPIQFRTADAQQDNEKLEQAVNILIEAKVDGIIGPMTSSQAAIIAPLVENARIPTFGPTVTTDALSNINDHFFRPVSSLQITTQRVADLLYRRLTPANFSIAIDNSNKTYTQNWQLNFAKAMAEKGVRQAYRSSFDAGDSIALLDISQQLARFDSDLIVLVTNATNAALMIKQIRTVNRDVDILVAEWAGSPQLLQLAGKDAEGVWVPRYIDDGSNDPRFLELRRQFRQRFGLPLGYSGLTAYNATNALLQAISNKQKEQTTKEYLLETSRFTGVLGDFELNDYGDALGGSYHFVTRVENGRYINQQ